MSRQPQPGDQIGHYRIDNVLGVGGMGMVFSATDLRLNRQVALKVMLAHVATSPTFLGRFQREASILARLDSPHVISIYDYGEQDGWPYLVTQHADGGDLGQLLRESGALPPPLAFRVCAQVADALSAAHAVGVIHRDVKPANVLLRDRRTDRLHVYLCDFGVAHTETTGLTTAGAVAGTWNYLAPERAAGERGTPASDIYSVGCLLFETLTGRPPYTGADVEVAMAHLQAPVPQLPGDDDLTTRVNEVLARSLAKDPAHRYGSAAEMRDALRALGGGLTPSGPSQPPKVLAHRRARRRRALGAVLAVALVASGATAALLLRPGGDDPATGGGGDDPTPTGSASGPLTPEPEPDPEPLVTGDIDGDGLGDFATVSYDSGAWLMRSDGKSFREPQPLPLAAYRSAVGDVDGDGRLDIVEVEGVAPSLSVTVHLATGEAPASLMQSPTLGDTLYGDDLPFVGDLDGDGRDDVGLASTGSGRLVITAARSRADGTLGNSRRWFDGDAPTGSGTYHELRLGDLTGDGRADLVQVTEAGPDSSRLRLLASTGSSFEERGEPQRISGDPRFISWRVGDFDADGTDEISMTDYGPQVKVVSWTGRRFRTETWLDEVREDFSPSATSVADVDGDGDDDLVVVLYRKGIRVLDSSGSSFRVVPGKVRFVPPRMRTAGTLDPMLYRD